MLLAVPFILVQRSIRRLLAYSSIDHTGIMLVGLGIGSSLSSLGTLLHMVYHAISKPLLFFCAGNVQQKFQSAHFRRIGGGVINVMPVTGTLFLAVALAVTGTPPFCLFQSELTILSACFQNHNLWVGSIFVGCVVTIFAGFLYHIGQLNLGSPPRGVAPSESDWWRLGPMLLLAALVLLLGFWLPSPLYRLIQQAGQIIGSAP